MATPSMRTALRTHTTSSLQDEDMGTQVQICGFFTARINEVDPDFNLSDAQGVVRISIDPTRPQALAVARKLGAEDIIQVTGEIKGLTADKPHYVEVRAREIQVFNKAGKLPFDIRKADFEAQVPFKKRLENRHLDIRRPAMLSRLKRRSQATLNLRQSLMDAGFMEVDTPILGPWTPEMPGTFAVPTSQYRNYGLMGTAQAYKQMLMAGGVDRYFQLAKCFRDEGTYGPFHQPEFTVLDLEMAYVEEGDICETVQSTLSAIATGMGHGDKVSFQRLSYQDAIEKYGTERPDLRFDLPIHDISDLAKASPSVILSGAVDPDMGGNGAVKAIAIPHAQAKDIEERTFNGFEKALENWPNCNATHLQVAQDKALSGSMSVAFDGDLKDQLLDRLGAQSGDTIVLIIAAHHRVAPLAAGAMRLHLAKGAGLLKGENQAFVWVHDIPYFTYHIRGNLYFPNRHPMTAPHDDDAAALDALLGARRKAAEEAGEPDPEQGVAFDKYIHPYGDADAEALAKIRSKGYELILNGEELATGSVRNHDLNRQRDIFELLDYDLEDTEAQFPQLYKALEHGMPPHGGLAIGLDRLFATLEGRKTVMDVIAFPKDGLGKDLLMNSPGPIPAANLQALLGVEKADPQSEAAELDESTEDAEALPTLLAAFDFTAPEIEVGRGVHLVDRSQSLSPITRHLWECEALNWASPLPNPRLLIRQVGEFEVHLTVETQSGRRAKAVGKITVIEADED